MIAWTSGRTASIRSRVSIASAIERQVGGDVGEALGVDSAPDSEPLDPAVQRRDLQLVAREAVHQRVVGHPAAAVERLAEVDVELQARADHVIACPT